MNQKNGQGEPLLIEDYALIGDCQTAAPVGRNGSIDWLCWPYFDSDACFAALLGSPENGRWLVAPASEVTRVTHSYRDNTMILETLFETEHGSVAALDFMPSDADTFAVVHRVEGRSGRLPMRMHLTLRFEYGSVTPWVTRQENGGGRGRAKPGAAAHRRRAARGRAGDGRRLPMFVLARQRLSAARPSRGGARAVRALAGFPQ